MKSYILHFNIHVIRCIIFNNIKCHICSHVLCTLSDFNSNNIMHHKMLSSLS